MQVGFDGKPAQGCHMSSQQGSVTGFDESCRSGPDRERLRSA